MDDRRGVDEVEFSQQVPASVRIIKLLVDSAGVAEAPPWWRNSELLTLHTHCNERQSLT